MSYLCIVICALETYLLFRADIDFKIFKFLKFVKLGFSSLSLMILFLYKTFKRYTEQNRISNYRWEWWHHWPTCWYNVPFSQVSNDIIPMWNSIFHRIFRNIRTPLSYRFEKCREHHSITSIIVVITQIYLTMELFMSSKLWTKVNIIIL